MATSTVAIGKLSVALRWGKPIPPGWALDQEGQPTTDPTVAYETRHLTPLGATRELGGHKGYGLAVMVDILAGVLAGATFADVRRRDPDPVRPDIGHFFGAIDIARFRDLDAFKADMDDLLRALKDSPKAEGQDRIYVAGEPEWECEQRRRREGIPLAPGLVSQLREVSVETGVAVHPRRLRRSSMPQFAYFCGHEQFQPEVLLEHAVLAESVGFDALTVSDHFHPWVDDASACGFAWTWLGALAVRTRRVRIATAVTCPLFHYHPGLVAQAAATVDRLSGGRFALGVGTGEGINERPLGFAFPGYKERAARMTEAIAIMRGLLAGEKLDFAGTYYRTDKARLYSPPVGPGPDLDVGRRPAVRHARRSDRRRPHPERQGARRGARADHRSVPRRRAGSGPRRADPGRAALVDPRRRRGRSLGGRPGVARAARRGPPGGGRPRRAAGSRRRHGSTRDHRKVRVGAPARGSHRDLPAAGRGRRRHRHHPGDLRRPAEDDRDAQSRGPSGTACHGGAVMRLAIVLTAGLALPPGARSTTPRPT